MESTIKRVIVYWLIAWTFAIIFGEVITGIISNNPVFFQHFIPIIIYYGTISFVFSLLFNKTKFWIVLVIIFVYGGLAEILFFKGINIFVVAGLFYVFLFGVPYFISTKIWHKRSLA